MFGVSVESLQRKLDLSLNFLQLAEALNVPMFPVLQYRKNKFWIFRSIEINAYIENLLELQHAHDVRFLPLFHAVIPLP